MNAVLQEFFDDSDSTSCFLTDADFGLTQPKGNNRSSYTLTNSLPPWFNKSLQYIVYLHVSLRENWDSYGARRITPQAANLAIEILQSIVQNSTPEPSLVPSPDGHIQAEWHVMGKELEVEFESSTSIRVLFEDLNNPARDWEEVLSTDLSRLSKAVMEISRL